MDVARTGPILKKVPASMMMPMEKSSVRRDAFNTEIRRGQKKHRLVFRDQRYRDQPLEDVHYVECWKQFNVEDPNEYKGQGKTATC